MSLLGHHNTNGITRISVTDFRKPKQPRRKTPTGSLTQAVIKYLNLHGFKVWRQNNLAAKGRKFTGLRGVPDCIGYERATGRFIGVEIKTGKDKLSVEQIEFGIEVMEAGGFWFMTGSVENFIEQLNDARKNLSLWNTISITGFKSRLNMILTKTRKSKRDGATREAALKVNESR